jgi:curli biogenesis system outer membrane secretion channel CsgG
MGACLKYDRWLLLGAVWGGLAMLAGCQTTPVEEVPAIARPEARPVKNITGFSESLRCMDDLFGAFGIHNVVITSQGIPDATGEIQAGTKEMLISAVSKMSGNSGAFRFVDYDQTQFDINALQNLVGFTNDFLVPNYYIRGAITQFDESVLSENLGGGISLPVLSAGASKDQTVSMVSVDLNVGDLLTRQIITGTSANNSIAVRRSGKSADAGGTIENIELGLNFNISLNRSEGMHQSIRTLVELSTIESLGKLTKVPYWRCLGMGQTDPKVISQARRWYSGMSRQEQVSFVQRALRAQGLYEGRVDGQSNPKLDEAVGLYQSSQGLLADQRIDFDLYASLISGDLAQGRVQPEDFSPASFSPSVQRPKEVLQFSITTDKGRQPTFRAGEAFAFTMQPSSDAFAYCYYKDAANTVVRVFPNRFQPDALVAGGSNVRVPGDAAQFEMVMEGPSDQEEVLCLASSLELGLKLPEHLKAADLTPLRVSSLDEVAQSFRRVSRGQVVEARLPIRVKR